MSKQQNIVIIRNITHIIENEKTNNQKKYLELLAGTVSHEMMTPLNSILNLSKIILDKIEQEELEIKIV
jgi:signal transduction histidine kinase